MDPIYRDKIIMSYKLLFKLQEKLMERIINLGMTGEYQDVNEVFNPGDTFKFHIDHFKNSSDVNVSKLVDFHEQLEELLNSMVTINNLTEDEMELNDDDMEDDYLDLRT